MRVNGAETVQRLSLSLSSLTTRERGEQDFLEKEAFVLDQVEGVGVCSEAKWKDGILVTEAQKLLVRTLVWPDPDYERRQGSDETGEGTRGWFMQDLQNLDFFYQRVVEIHWRFPVKE